MIKSLNWGTQVCTLSSMKNFNPLLLLSKCLDIILMGKELSDSFSKVNNCGSILEYLDMPYRRSSDVVVKRKIIKHIRATSKLVPTTRYSKVLRARNIYATWWKRIPVLPGEPGILKQQLKMIMRVA